MFITSVQSGNLRWRVCLIQLKSSSIDGSKHNPDVCGGDQIVIDFSDILFPPVKSIDDSIRVTQWLCLGDMVIKHLALYSLALSPSSTPREQRAPDSPARFRSWMALQVWKCRLERHR